MSDLISRKAAMNAIMAVNDYGEAARACALGLAELAVATLPAEDAVSRPQLAETIRHCAKYPDGMIRLLKIYGGAAK